jgi:hypothetical protein
MWNWSAPPSAPMEPLPVPWLSFSNLPLLTPSPGRGGDP